jgi:hypothetical protein
MSLFFTVVPAQFFVGERFCTEQDKKEQVKRIKQYW